MTDILCSWLNNELKLSKTVDATNFAREFSTGYLVGEVLKKHSLQHDFDQFSQSKTANSKIGNFTRLEPVLHLLDVPFNINITRDMMTEKEGVATRLMYQLFISLNRKEKAHLTGTAMETMRPAAPLKLESIESGIYKERIKVITKRQTDTNLEMLKGRFTQKKVDMEEAAFKERFEEEEKHVQDLLKRREMLIAKYKNSQEKQSEMLAKIQAATLVLPKPPPNRSARVLALQRQVMNTRVSEDMKLDISLFEDRMKRTIPPSKPVGEYTEGQKQRSKDKLELIKPVSNHEYIGKIRNRLNEDAVARAEREKRRRKVLVDQLKSHEGQEDARREEMLVNRLMRQSQQERRIAVQLLQVRHEKDVVRQNRIMREKQYEELRLKEFEDALNKEAEIARLAKIIYSEQTKQDKELHDQITQARAEALYKKHYESCMDILLSMVDFTCKIGEYRELTNKLLPEKLMRDWTSLFVDGQPLYEATSEEPEVQDEELNAHKLLEEERQNLLDEGDLTEYRNMFGEWQVPIDSGILGPPRNNPVVGHIIQRLYDIVNPPTPPPPPPTFPPFPVKACIVGKAFAGKSSCARKLAELHCLHVLCVDDLVTDAVDAHKNREIVDHDLVLPPMTATPASAADKTAAENLPEPNTDNRDKPVEKPKEEGMEKSDPEKPVPVESGKKKTSLENAPSKRAKLGSKAMKFLKRGKPVDDQMTVDIIVEAINRIPEEMGWILDGFPTTYQQAKLLEKALTGMENMSPQHKKASKSHKSSLAPDPRPPKPPEEPGSGINVVILFDMDNKLALKRSAGRTYGVKAEEGYHPEFNAPPPGSATGIGKQEQVMVVEDVAHDEEQIQHRLTTFQDQWPKMEKWFNKFGTLRKVDASNKAKTVFLEVENVLEETLRKLRGTDKEEVPESLEVKQEEVAPVESEKAVEPLKEEPPPEETTRSRAGSKKGSRAGSAKRSVSRSSSKSKSPGRAESKAKEKKPRESSAGKASSKRSRSAKKGKTPDPDPELPPEPPSTPIPIPGSDEWEFVDKIMPEEMAQILAPQWDMVEKTYIDGSKIVFRSIREEREKIVRYFYQIRRDFKAFLRRPDTKQEFVSSWQNDYNELSDDLRDDEETRSELHERVDDLRERLWSVCDDRKSSAEECREAVITDGWLEDHLGLLANYYIMLAQGEVDRFQDTIRLLKDYYKAMDGKIPDELAHEVARIPLVELPVDGRPESAPMSAVGGSGTGTRPVTPAADEAKSVTSKSVTPSGKKKKDKSVVEVAQAVDAHPGVTVHDEKRSRVPLVPRRPLTPDTSGPQLTAKGSKADKGKGSKVPEVQDTSQPPDDPDDRLVYSAHHTAFHIIDKLIAHEQALREAEEDAERALALEKEKEKEKEKAVPKGKGKKGRKSRTPSPKKTKGSPAPTTPQPQMEETAEEKLRKKMITLARLEFFAAMEEEAEASKVRLSLTRAVAYGVLADLRGKASGVYTDMNDWLGARFLKEMESIDQMSEVMRNAIETSSHVKEQLVIYQEDFLVNQDVVMAQFEKDMKVLRTPSPIPPPPPIETAYPDTFTVDQVMNLYQQFSLTAPSGMLSVKAFQEIFADLAALTHGTEQIPDMWMHITPERLELMASQLSPDGESIDWRTLILAAAQPWPMPSQSELLDTLSRFKEMDQKHTGFVTRPQFERVSLWFTATNTTPTSVDEIYVYDRVTNLKMTFFDVFADHEKDPPRLDYVNMLLYFSIAPDPYEGFLRALSVSSGTHMPRLPDLLSTVLHPASQTSFSDEHEPVEVEFVEETVAEVAMEDIPEDAFFSKVPLEALDKVLRHGQIVQGASHRFPQAAKLADSFVTTRLQGVYHDLGSDSTEPVFFTNLAEHPIIQDLTNSVMTYKAIDLKSIFLSTGPEADVHSVKTGE